MLILTSDTMFTVVYETSVLPYRYYAMLFCMSFLQQQMRHDLWNEGVINQRLHFAHN